MNLYYFRGTCDAHAKDVYVTAIDWTDAWDTVLKAHPSCDFTRAQRVTEADDVCISPKVIA